MRPKWLGKLFRIGRSPSDRPPPQLQMARDDLDDLPEIVIPEGYELRTFRPGDEGAWCEIMEGSVGQGWTAEKCRTQLTEDARFRPENLFFATCDGQPVGSACAWQVDLQDRQTGRVHMVAVLEEHRGKGLGRLLNAAVLRRLKDLGFHQADLLTDDWRHAAIKTYLSIGFRPRHTHSTHPERWEAVFAELGVDGPRDG